MHKHTYPVTGFLAAAGLLVAGCGGSDDGDDGDPTPSPTVAPTEAPTGTASPFGDDTAAAPAVRSLADEACQLPITFDLADKWTVEEVSPDLDFETGGLNPVCEIDAKPAGAIGYLRVWTGPEEDPQTALDTFAADQPGEIEDSESRTIEIAGTEAAEVDYVYVDGLEERKRESAFAVPTDDGVAVVTISGLDDEEYEAMLPAYVLARETTELSDD